MLVEGAQLLGFDSQLGGSLSNIQHFFKLQRKFTKVSTSLKQTMTETHGPVSILSEGVSGVSGVCLGSPAASK